MNLEQRRAAIEEIESRRLSNQRDYVKQWNSLEENHGLDLDVITQIYGSDILELKGTTLEELDKFKQLFAELDKEARFLCVGGISKRLRDGCYGFGAKPVYDPVFRIAFFDQRDTKVSIEYVNRSDESQSAIALRGLGSVVRPKSEKPDPRFLSEEVFEIASPATAAKPWFTNLDIILSDDTTAGLGSKFYSTKSAGGYDNVGMWYHDWLDAREDGLPAEA